MSHSDVIKRLFPVELSGAFDTDIAIEGAHLDDAQKSAETLLREMFADLAYAMLPDWERVCGFTPGADDTLQLRRDRVIRKLREIGGLSRAYFIALAASMGYTITIDEFNPMMCGWSYCGDTLYVEAARFIWRINVSGSAVYYFRAGESACGERLLWWPDHTDLETLFNELKPAHTYLIFNYS